MGESVFAANRDPIWNYSFDCTLEVTQLAGGVPSDPEVARGWLRTRLFGEAGRDAALADMVAQTMEERGISAEEAVDATPLRINGFKRQDGNLVAEGRTVKAMLKENFSIAAAGGHIPTGAKWGKTNKGLLGFVAEHVQVPERFIPLSRIDTGRPLTGDDVEVQQRFVSGRYGQSIKYEEVVDASVSFTVLSDWDFGDHVWATVWTLAEQNGLGTSRSQGNGKFIVTRWEPSTKRRRRIA